MDNIKLRSIVSTFIVIGIIISPFLVSNGVISNVKGEETKKVKLYMETKYQTSNIIEDVVINDDFAYIAKGSGGLEIINTSELPYLSRTVTHQHNNAKIVGVEMLNNTVYVLQKGPSNPPFNDSLDSYDVTIPMEAVRIGGFFIDCMNDVGELYVHENMAYVTTGEKLVLVNLSNPSNLTKAGEFDYDDPHFLYPEVIATDNIAYVGTDNEGLHIINISNPANSVKIGNYDISSLAISIVVVDNIMYITDWSGLEIVNISTPSTPKKIGRFNLEERTRAGYVAVKDDIAFFTYWTYEYWDIYTGPQGIEDSGIIAVDLSKQDNLIKIGKYEGMNFASKIVAYNDLLYVVDDHDLCIFKIEISEEDKDNGGSFSWVNLGIILSSLITCIGVISGTIAITSSYKRRKIMEKNENQKQRFRDHLQSLDNMKIKYKTNIKTYKEKLLSKRAEIKSELHRDELKETQFAVLDRRIDVDLREIRVKTEEDTVNNEEDIVKGDEDNKVKNDIDSKVDEKSPGILEEHPSK